MVRKSLECYDPSDFVTGCTVDLGMWVVEINAKLNVEEYTSGRVFLQPQVMDILSLWCIVFFIVHIQSPLSSRRQP